jgi:tRNA-Thr(GGU) m(6)t(6)A37 methyltransferase TsaA
MATARRSYEDAKMQMTSIGVIRSPFVEPGGMPIQPAGAADVHGTVEVFERYQSGLEDLDGFSHIILLYIFHRNQGYDLSVVPFLDSEPRGLFATRAPRRPNPIGLSVVRLDRIEDGVLHIRGVDMVDGTPLLDIKPYVPAFDVPTDVRTGWLESVGGEASLRESDDRFR